MTDKERDLTREMLDLIERIKNKTDTINTNDRIPELELDVILSKIEQLNQKAIVLKYLHRHADELTSTSTEDYFFDDDNDEDVVGDDSTQDIAEPIETDAEKDTNPPSEPNISMEKIESDLSVLGGSSLTETNESAQVDVVEKIKLQPINDIKLAIGINDKFLFINELFGGNSEAFDTLVSELNQLNTLEEAQSKFNHYNWDKDNETVQSFLTIVTRKFI